MIKQLIKRDGTLETFSPEKLNGWGIWATENIDEPIDWSDIVLQTVASIPGEQCTTTLLHDTLIDSCLQKRTWRHNRMAGRLYASKLYKDLYNGKIPSIKHLHEEMVTLGVLDEQFYAAFSSEEYTVINSYLDHDIDLTYAHYQIDRIVKKYSLQDRQNNTLFETPQFVYMRVAMRMAQNKPNRLEHIKNFYYLFSNNIINIPTPYFTNSGTSKNGFASCCVYTTKDEVGSLHTGDVIAYGMTYSSAGIGGYIQSRSVNDKVRGGIIEHQGKLPYYRSVVAAVKANLQNGRGGAITLTYSCYDPEVFTIQKLKNPLTPQESQIRGADYTMSFNEFFARKAAKNEQVALFSMKDAPEIYENITATTDEFERLYNKAIEEKRYTKLVSARDILVGALTAAIDTGRHYWHNVSEVNRHTPFKDDIVQTNLCVEVNLPSKGFDSIDQLYKEEESGEVGICSLAGIVVPNVKSEEEYRLAAYYSLLMINTGINESDYVFPQIGYTSRARNSAGVAILGLAHHLAKNQLLYTTPEGKQEIHRVAERHYWHLANASLELSKEYGNAHWIDRSKWVSGWTPLETYNRNVDSIVQPEYNYDWKDLSERIKQNGGIHNSVLVCQLPSESSSVAGGTTNGVYPIRRSSLVKTNDSEVTYFVVPEYEKYKDYYQLAYDIPTEEMIKCYAIIQKFTDQGMSCDDFKRLVGSDKLESKELLRDFFTALKYGQKSRYYVNQETSSEVSLSTDEPLCESCTL